MTGRARYGDAKSATINIRVTPDLKAELVSWAQASGRTLASECEIRLRDSLEYEFRVQRMALS